MTLTLTNVQVLVMSNKKKILVGSLFGYLLKNYKRNKSFILQLNIINLIAVE